MPLDGPLLALISGAKFVSRGFSGNPGQLASHLESAMTHNGYSLVEVFSPCVTHNKVNTYKWFQSHIRDVDGDTNYDAEDRSKAMALFNDPEKLPAGLIFKSRGPSFEDLSLLGRTPIVFTDLERKDPRLNKMLEKFE